jgi:Uma2 family endonuclease
MHMVSATRGWTFDDLARLPDDGNRYEIIDGKLFVTPSPSWRHQEAVLELAVILREYLARELVGHAFIAPADVVFSDRRVVEPDVLVAPLVGGRRPDRAEDILPLLLAVEVLSPSTARTDRVDKCALFREEGVPEYWIVDLDSRIIERSTPGDVRPEILTEQLAWHPKGASAPLVVDVAAYFARVLDG